MTALLLAPLAGALLGAFIFAPYNLGFLAPLFPLPLFLALNFSARREFKAVWKREFPAIYLFFLLFALENLWWIGHVTVAGMLALCLFYPFVMALPLFLASFFMHRGCRAPLALSGAWLLGELAMAYIFTGFPWLSLGYALSGRLCLMQAAEIGGVHLLSFILVFAAAALADFACRDRRSIFDCAVPGTALLLFLALGIYGYARIRVLDGEKPLCSLKSGFVQLNLPPELKHDSARDERTLTEYFEATLRLSNQGLDLIVWPETGIPGIYNDSYNPAYARMREFRRTSRTPLLCGLSWAQKESNDLLFYNAAALLDNDLMEPYVRYYKKHLVLFGEYVPLEKELPFLKFLTPIAGSYSKGALSHALPLKIRGGRTVRLGALICFEDVFPVQSREAVREGADVLVNITNDGWFWNSPGAYQHAAISRLRAVENRRPLMRSANTGRTVCYDRLGRETASLEKEGRSVLVKGEMTAEIPVHDHRITFYAANGDWPCLALGLLMLLVSRLGPGKP